MKYFAFIVMFFITCTAAVPTGRFKIPYHLGPKQYDLGKVDGKSYVVDSTLSTWFEADSLCKASGMKLATVTSSAQKDFLQSKFNYAEFTAFHWTGGQDVQAVEQFVWHNSESPVSESFVDVQHVDVGFQSCLMYDSEEDFSHFHLTLCTKRYKVLCEL